jgi:Fe2+ transport system protein FeoA
VRAGALITKLIPTPLQDPVECLVGPQLLALERRLLARIQVEAA